MTEVHPQECRDLPEKFTKKVDIPFSEEGRLSDDWFDPEERYSTRKTKNDLHVKLSEEKCFKYGINTTVKRPEIAYEYRYYLSGIRDKNRYFRYGTSQS